MRLSSFSRRSCSSTSPQSPAMCRARYPTGASPDASNAAMAPGVATIRPGWNFSPATASSPCSESPESGRGHSQLPQESAPISWWYSLAERTSSFQQPSRDGSHPSDQALLETSSLEHPQPLAGPTSSSDHVRRKQERTVPLSDDPRA